ncbi:hypothetical protein [Halomarina litorea]|uniref:hypothetical protein n=1 Tax=Halomarina litorea TaxID=2961595 RepID=UPI0020C49F68|nr:hypothetical protein [Halomarina sp. BCD28]
MISFTPSERFYEAAGDWADSRLMDPEEALEVKAEQALLEIENLVSGAHEVTFEVGEDGETVRLDPSPELDAFLEERAAEAGLDQSTLLRLYVDLFARVFLDENGGQSGRPPNAPPE